MSFNKVRSEERKKERVVQGCSELGEDGFGDPREGLPLSVLELSLIKLVERTSLVGANRVSPFLVFSLSNRSSISWVSVSIDF
jgi:hypothetical protein